MDTKALYSQKYGQLFSAFIALSALVSLIFFGVALANESSPLESHEVAGTAEVAKVSYGSSLETSIEERPRNIEGKRCFIEFSDGTVVDKPILGCDFKAGDMLQVFSSAEETRIDPQEFPAVTLALQFYLGASIALVIGALLSLIYFTVKKVKIERKAFNAIRL